MRERFTLTGTVEEQLKQIERFLQHLGRRRERVARAIIPPFPVSGYVERPDVDEVVFRFIAPDQGKILRGVLLAETHTKDLVGNVQVVVEGEGTKQSKYMLLFKGKTCDLPEVELEKGARYIVYLSHEEGEDKEIKGIWTGVLFQLSVDKDIVQNYLLDELLKGEEE